MKTLLKRIHGILLLVPALILSLYVTAQEKTPTYSEVTIDKKFTAVEVSSIYK